MIRVLLFFVLLCLSSFIHAAYWTDSRGITWCYNYNYDNTITVGSGDKNSPAISQSTGNGLGIHAYFDGRPVRTLAAYSFYGCSNLTSISIPGTVKTIGAHAFEGCSGASVMTIPASVTSIKEAAFLGCNGVKVDEANPSYSSDEFGVLFDKTKTTLIQAPADLVSYVIPSSVTVISAQAFSGCSMLTSVTLPSSKVLIGAHAFDGCSSLPVIEHMRYGNTSKEFLISLAEKFEGDIKLPSGVRIIYDEAFEGCGGITSVFIPESVEYIGAKAFADCTSISKVTIMASSITMSPDSFLNVCPEWFYGAVIPEGMSKVKLSKIEFSPSPCEVNNLMFAEYPAVRELVFHSGLRVVGANAFANFNNLTRIELPYGVERIENDAFKNCSGVDVLNIPATVKKIGARAFTGCKGVQVEADNPFYTSEAGFLFSADMRTLLHAPVDYAGAYTLPADVQIVGEEAFMGCEGLTAISLPSVATIQPSAFKNCTGLTLCQVANALQSIQMHAFEGAAALTKFVMPSSVRTLETAAFKGCVALAMVTFQGKMPQVVEAAPGETVFSGDAYSTQMGTYPIEFATSWEESLSSDQTWQGLSMVRDRKQHKTQNGYQYRLYCGEATIMGIEAPLTGDINLPEVLGGVPVVGIAEQAFAECFELSSVTIPSSYTTIGADAFADCTALTTVTFLGLPPNAGQAETTIFPVNTAAVGFYPKALKFDWRDALTGDKWNGLTMKQSGLAAYRIKVTVSGPGSVSGNTVVPVGQQAVLTAIPGAGSRFIGWDGAVSASTAELTIMPENDLSLTALFAPTVLVDSVVTEAIDSKLASGELLTKSQAETATQNVIDGKVSSGDLVPKANVEQKAQDIIDAKVEAHEYISADQLKVMAMESPMIEVKGGQATLGLTLQKSDKVDGVWKDVTLEDNATTVKEGAVSVQVKPEAGENAAFYKFVVPQKQ